MIHDPLSGDPSSASQITGFSPAALLWRAALGAGKQDALVSADRRISYRELAERLACARESATQAGFDRRFAGRSASIDDVLAFCEALTQPGPIYSADLLAPCAPPCTSGSPGAIAAGPAPRPRPRNFTIDAARFDALTLVRLVSESRGWGWTSEALSYGWGMAAPLPGTVSVMTGPVGAPISWAALFGVLTGRGRVLVPPGDLTDSLDLLSSEGVGELHLELGQARRFLARAAKPCTTLKRVSIWHDGAVPLDELRALASCFPGARVSRVLAWTGGPVSVAALAQLETHGEGFLGTRSLGSRLTVSPNGTLLIGESPWLPIEVGGPGEPGCLPKCDTGIALEEGAEGGSLRLRGAGRA